METNGGIRPTPQQARAALDEVRHVQATTAALSATPWPRWFTATLTVYIAAIPPVYGGVVASPEWLLPSGAWLVIMLILTVGFLALFAVAGANWRRKTGVALRMDVLPRRAVLALMTGLPALLVGAVLVFRLTAQPAWLFAASLVGAAVSLAAHRTFVRLHRKGA
ncbi:hypothetical protein [Streptomyces sp. NPDC048172]|uniref:hypothetical protein n=1 Tax=Streptomyces sp. NPDC048172 TaxID=3365505 RepID=UPI003714ABE9